MYHKTYKKGTGQQSRLALLGKLGLMTGVVTLSLAACGSTNSSASTSTKATPASTQLTIEGNTAPATVNNLNPYNGQFGVDLMMPSR